MMGWNLPLWSIVMRIFEVAVCQIAVGSFFNDTLFANGTEARGTIIDHRDLVLEKGTHR